jgi:hypothetical protein
VVYNTPQTSSMVLFLAVASNIYGSVLTRLGATTLLAGTLLELPISPMAMLALLMPVLFPLGWPLGWPVIIFTFVPIFSPVVEGLSLAQPPDEQERLIWCCSSFTLKSLCGCRASCIGDSIHHLALLNVLPFPLVG